MSSASRPPRDAPGKYRETERAGSGNAGIEVVNQHRRILRIEHANSIKALCGDETARLA
jgi:hypothetical protein